MAGHGQKVPEKQPYKPTPKTTYHQSMNKLEKYARSAEEWQNIDLLNASINQHLQTKPQLRM